MDIFNPFSHTYYDFTYPRHMNTRQDYDTPKSDQFGSRDNFHEVLPQLGVSADFRALVRLGLAQFRLELAEREEEL